MKRTTLMFAVLLLAGCGAPEAPPPAEAPPEGRAETQSIRNTDAIGYDGAAIADQVDQTLDANERRVQQTEDATQE